MKLRNEQANLKATRTRRPFARLIGPILPVTILAFSGCAFVNQDVGLSYNPVVNASGGAGSLAIARPDCVSIQKNGKGQFVIGTVRNGWGMKTADTVTSDSPGDWLALALKTELTRAGYDVVLLESVPAASPKALAITVNRVWVDHDMGFWTVGAAAEISFRLELFRNGQKVDVLAFRETAEPRSMVGGTAKQKGEALQTAMQACMYKAVPGIIRIMEKSP